MPTRRLFIARLLHVQATPRSIGSAVDLQAHRPERIAIGWQPPGVGDEQLRARDVLDDRAVKHAAEPPEHLVRVARGLPLDGIYPKHPRSGHRSRHVPPARERRRIEKRFQHCRRRRIDGHFMVEARPGTQGSAAHRRRAYCRKAKGDERMARGEGWIGSILKPCNRMSTGTSITSMSVTPRSCIVSWRR